MATEASGAPAATKSRNISERSRIRVPEGVVDHPPASALAIRRHQDAIAYVFDLYGYAHVLTPIFELLETLEVGLGEDARRAAFRLVDPATGEIGVLRPDFTAQIARMVSARLSGLPRPLRLAYGGRIARAADPLGRGLYAREVFQAGIEMIGGADALDPDVEVLSIGAECFRALGRKVTIDLGHSAIAEALSENGRPSTDVGRALAAKDTRRLEALAPELVPLLDLYGGPEILDRAEKELPPATHGAIGELRRAAERLTRDHPDVHVTFDLGERRSLGYYTSLFFAGYVEGASDAVMSGGRYDRLLERFGTPEPAVGLAIDVGALVGPGPHAHVRRGLVVTCGLEEEAQKRRRRGQRVAVVPEEDAKAYADAHGFEAVVSRDRTTGAIREERLV